MLGEHTHRPVENGVCERSPANFSCSYEAAAAATTLMGGSYSCWVRSRWKVLPCSMQILQVLWGRSRVLLGDCRYICGRLLWTEYCAITFELGLAPILTSRMVWKHHSPALLWSPGAGVLCLMLYPFVGNRILRQEEEEEGRSISLSHPFYLYRIL